jgi:voltage-gated potassium channel
MTPLTAFKRRCAQCLHQPDQHVRSHRLINGFLVLLIILNVLAIILESVPSLQKVHAQNFHAFEIFSVVIFTLEYVLRLWSVPLTEKNPNNEASSRWRYFLRPMSIIDLLAILPFYLSLFVVIDLRFLRLFRLLRLLKLSRHFQSMGLLMQVIYQERQPLMSSIIIMLATLLLASSLIYLAEHHVQPELFSSIPAAMWWGIATLTTVGYGDITPITPLGRFLGSIIAVLGVGTFALPTGILASAFSEQLKQHGFLKSWNAVADVRLFSHLNASQIATLSALLSARQVNRGDVLFRRGETADSVYFILSGEVTMDFEDGRPTLQLTDGDFFGAMALLESGVRPATAHSVGHCQLMVLAYRDFHALLQQDDALKQSIHTIIEKRLHEDESQQI